MNFANMDAAAFASMLQQAGQQQQGNPQHSHFLTGLLSGPPEGDGTLGGSAGSRHQHGRSEEPDGEQGDGEDTTKGPWTAEVCAACCLLPGAACAACLPARRSVPSPRLPASQEDEKLTKLVHKHGPRNWSLMSKSIPGRSGKSCRLRWGATAGQRAVVWCSGGGSFGRCGGCVGAREGGGGACSAAPRPPHAMRPPWPGCATPHAAGGGCAPRCGPCPHPNTPRAAARRRCAPRRRWLNQLNPQVKKGPFSAEEDLVILALHRLHGNKWATIAKHMPGR